VSRLPGRVDFYATELPTTIQRIQRHLSPGLVNGIGPLFTGWPTRPVPLGATTMRLNRRSPVNGLVFRLSAGCATQPRRISNGASDTLARTAANQHGRAARGREGAYSRFARDDQSRGEFGQRGLVSVDHLGWPGRGWLRGAAVGVVGPSREDGREPGPGRTPGCDLHGRSIAPRRSATGPRTLADSRTRPNGPKPLPSSTTGHRPR
jgi:hypothetical protein